MADKAEQVMKKRTKEYIRDTFILLIVLAIVVTGVVLAIKFLKGKVDSIVLYNENGEALGTYSKDNDVQVPSKSGYSTSWVAESGATYESIQAALDNGEPSVKIVYSPIVYTVTLYLTGGALDGDLGFEKHEATEGQEDFGEYYTKTYTVEDADFDLPAIDNAALATRHGFTFGFWSNINYIKTNYTADKLKSTEIKNVKTNTARDIAFYAVWKDIPSTIHVYGVTKNLIFYEEYRIIDSLDETHFTEKALTFDHEGYTFDGFYTDQDFKTPYTFGDEIGVPVLALYTKWIAQPFTLTFKDVNENILQSSTVCTGEEISFFDYESVLAPGKNFLGWSLNNVAFTSEKMLPKDITLYPILENIPYSITWYVDASRQETETYFYGDEPQAPSTLNTDKAEDESHTYVFDGWSPAITSVTDSITYTAQYKSIIKKFTYSIEVNNEEVVSPTLVEYGTAIVFPADPSSYMTAQYEYTFDKWVIKDTNITPETVTKDMTIVALFNAQIRSYTVSWEDKDGTTVYSTEVEYGTEIDLNAGRSSVDDTYEAEVSGHNRVFSFKGWSIGNIFQNSNSYTVVGPTIVVAKYEDDSDKSNYVLLLENGDTLAADTYYVGEADDLYALIMGIVRTKDSDETYSYTFDGWYYDKAGVQTKLTESTKADLNIPKDATITLKEKFTATYIPYTITWNLDNGEEPVVATYHYGEVLHPEADLLAANKQATKAPTVSTVYTFSGWNNTSDVVTKSTTYTAQYSEQIRTYTYRFYNGTQEVKTNTINYDAVIVAPVDPSKDATAQYTYTFSGWYAEPTDTIFVAGMKISGDIDFYAQYNETVNQYTYIFYMDDGETVVLESKEDYGFIVAKPVTNPSKVGTAKYTYTFAGWETLDGVAYVDNQELVADVIYIATFNQTINSYTYKFYNGSDVFETNTVEYESEIAISNIDTPTKADDVNMYTYTFNGWYDNALCEGTPITGTITILDDVDFYAGYTKTPINHTYTFKKLATDEEAYAEIEVGYGLAITAPQAPTRDHYDFAGWNESIPPTMGTENKTFIATWTPVVYHVNYTLHGGSATTNIKEFTIETADEALVLKVAGDSTKTGYTLKGWKYGNTTITSIKDANVYADITVEAVFEANKYTITYDVGNKPNTTIANPSKEVTYDGTYGTLDVPSVHGYTFEGWYLNNSYADQDLITSASNVKIEEDTTIYAKWSLTPYYVHGYIGNTKVAEFTFNVEEAATLTTLSNAQYDFAGWYKENIYDTSVTPTSPITSYSDTTGSTITKVYALVKTTGLTIVDDTVTGYEGTYANVIIPRMWNGTNVTTIGEEAFMENDVIESINAPFITEIKASAFEGCVNLVIFDLSNVETIRSKAFLGCSLTTANLSSATTIESRAFIYSSVQTITLNSAIVEPLGSYAFGQCNITAIHYSGTQAKFEALVANKGNTNLTWAKVQP